MSPRPSSTTRELVALYSRAGHGEHNLGAFLRERPELVARLGRLDLECDDADLALQLAPAIGRYKRTTAGAHSDERASRAAAAAQHLTASAVHHADRVELEPRVLLGELLAGSQKYISLELTTTPVWLHRQTLLRAKTALRPFRDLNSFVDERGLHLRWRAGRGGLNLGPQAAERGVSVLHVDLRPVSRLRGLRQSPPVLLADVLTDLGFI